MDLKYPEAIVDCNWLYNRLDDDNIRIYDCTTILHYTDDHPDKPYDVESGFESYKISHIPSASFLDLQRELSDNSSKYKFTLLNSDDLAESFKKNGIGEPFHIIYYSRNGMQWSTRLWWMTYYLGYKNISILDGGINEWEKLGMPVEKKERKYNPTEFNLSVNPQIFVDKNYVINSINDSSSILINALTEDLHKGYNPRYGRPGRIPKSINIPFHLLIDNGSYKFKSYNELINEFNQKQVHINQKIINYCGGGISATLNAFVLYQLGFNDIKIYDNSMSEWAKDENLPIEKD